MATLAIPQPGLLDSDKFRNQMQKLKRRDLVVWFEALFPDRKWPDQPAPFLASLGDGVVLCELANIIQRDSIEEYHTSPANPIEGKENVERFLKFSAQLGLADAQLFQTFDLTDSREDTAMRREERVVQTLLLLGVLSNDIGQAPARLEVQELVELEDQDRQMRSARLPRPTHNRSLTTGDVDQYRGKKMSIRRMGKDKSVRFSLTSNKKVASGLNLPGADRMTVGQLEKLHELTGGGFGQVPGAIDLTQSDMDKRRQSRLPPGLDREGSLELGLGLAVLAKALSKDDITIELEKEAPFMTTDTIKVGDEVMEVKGVMKKSVMVSRGCQGTKAERHALGATVSQVADDHLDKASGMYEVLRNRALEEEFEDLEEMDFLELLEDVSEGEEGSMTFVYIVSEKYDKSRNLDSKGNHNTDRLLAYLINRMELIVNTRYSIIYFHSAKQDHQLEFAFLSKAFTVLSEQYHHNLHHLWIVHPTVWVKMAFFFCQPFVGTEVTNKVLVCESLNDLYQDFEVDGLPLPAAVLKTEQDRKSSWF